MIMYRIHFPATLVASLPGIWRTCSVLFDKHLKTLSTHFPFILNYLRGLHVAKFFGRSVLAELGSSLHSTSLGCSSFFPLFSIFLPALFEFLARPTTFNDLARESQKVCCKYLTKNHPSGSAIIYLISFCVSQTLAKSSAQICNFYAHET